MRTNIERAIDGLITANKDITLANTLPAYFQEAGFTKMTLDALAAFEHALDKYPRRPDASRAIFTNGILGISAEYWSTKTAALDDSSCNMCDDCACCMFNLKLDHLKVELRGHQPLQEEGTATKVPKRRLKSKKGRRVGTKRDVVTAGFDPYAASTSAVML